MRGRDVVRRMILNEVERMQAKVQSFDEDPISFILQKYPTLQKTLEMLMSPAYKDYLSAVHIVAPKPTTFKVTLHNDQSIMLTFLGKAYEASVAGKKFYLQTIGERERAVKAIARLLAMGSPIQTEGPEGEEQVAGEEGGGGASFGGGGGGGLEDLGPEPEGAPEELTPGEEEAGETES